MTEPKADPKISSSSEEKDVNVPSVIERQLEAITHSGKSPQHHRETHGTSDEIDEDTPIDEVKGPGVFGRVKEEIEALVEAIHPKKKDKSDHSSS